MSLLVTIPYECQPGGGGAHLRSISGGSGSYTYTLARASDGAVPYSGGVTAAQLAREPLDFDGLFDDAYTFTAVDAADTTNFGTSTFTLSCGYPNPGGGGDGGGDGGGGGGGTDPPPTPEPVPGCTDKAATNYDPDATLEAGTCTYAPVPVAAYFSVPLLQTLRFIIRGGDFETLDNVLFCEQTRPGQQVRPYFYQLVETGDPVRVQVLSSYPAVSARIFHHGGAQVGAAVALTKVLALTGAAAPLAVALSQDAASGTTRVQAAAGGSLPASLLATARLTLAGAAVGTYQVTAAATGTLASPDDYVLLNRPWVAPGAGDVTASWQLAGPGYNVWEADLPLARLAAGYYAVTLTASGGGYPAATAESEPLHLAERHRNTVVLDYANVDNAYGLCFSTGIQPRLRVPGTFFRQPTPGGTLSTYRATNGKLSVLASTATRLRQLETYALPAYLHEKLFVICRLDALAVDGVVCVTDQAYEVSEQRTYPLAGGRVVLEETSWLTSGNGDDAGTDEAPKNALALRRGGFLLLRRR